MNWIKRLFRLFKDEADNIDEELGHQHDNITMVPEVKSNREKSKEVDAKIVYQYPKGAFRFPLVPDDDKENRIRPIMKKKEQEIPKQPEYPERRQEETRRQNPPKPLEPIIRKRKPAPVQENKSSRPFKPTTIPSPIFGYKERPEIRKGSFLRPDDEEKAADKPNSVNRELYHRYSQTLDGVPVVMKPGENRFNPLELNLSKSQTNIEKTELSIRNDEDCKPEMQANHEVVQEGRKIEISSVETLAKDPIEQEQIKADIEQATFVKKMDSPVSLFMVEEEITATAIMKEDELENEKPVTVETASALEDDSAAVLEEKPTSAEQLSLLDETLDGLIQTDILERDTEPKESMSSQEQTQTETSARSTIPFNVIMLNQDKLRLMERELRKSTNTIESDKSTDLEQDNTIVIADQSFQVIATIDEKVQQTTAADENTVQTLQVHENQKEGAEQEMEPANQQQDFSFPSIELLTPPVFVEENDQWIEEQKELLNTTLKNFNVGAAVVNVTQGPSVTRFEVQPEPGVKVNKITNLSDDIKLSLAARDIRIEAPIPGKHTIGIEVPNNNSRPVYLSEIVSKPEFIRQNSPLAAALGLDISGKPIVSDLRKMPHGLIAGATGSGKSVCINTILVSFLYKAKPEELKLLLIDPKMVELAPYNHIPHLVSPVITDVKAATAALKWAVEEMERRYELFAHTGVRDIGRFNELAEKSQQHADKLPYIVIIIDELADLMMMSPADVEEAICRIAQKARACGIHLIIATQRPSVDVITGLIKANIPTRIAFSVSSQVDSRTIIDMSGAEKLLGRGDMLFLENGSSKPIRLQGTFVSDEEIDEVVKHAREQGEPNYLFEQEELLKKAEINEAEDELFYEACEFVIENGGASSSMLQRRFKIGYNRAARLIDMMVSHGYISESRGSKPRDVFITAADLESLQLANKSI